MSKATMVPFYWGSTTATKPARDAAARILNQEPDADRLKEMLGLNV